MRRGGLFGFRRVVMALAVGAMVVAGWPPSPAAAQDDDRLSVVVDTLYRVLPDDGVVEVEITYAITNRVPNYQRGFTTYQTYFDSFFEALPESAIDVEAHRTSGRALTMTVVDPPEGAEEPNFVFYEIDLGPRLYYRQTRDLVVTYRLPDGEQRDVDAWSRVNPAIAAFPVLARGDTGESSVRVEFPDGYEVEALGSDIPTVDSETGQAWELTAIEDPYDWFALFVGVADHRLDRVGATGLGATYELTIASWPGDNDWHDFVDAGLSDSISFIESATGIDWPLDGELEVVEAIAPALAGYGGWYYEPVGSDKPDAAIEVGEELGLGLLGHEIAHTWFNDSFSYMRWLKEGLSEYYGTSIAREFGSGDLNEFDPVVASPPDAVDLLRWQAPNFGDSDKDAELFGYAASYQVISTLADNVGEQRFGETIAMLWNRENPYRPTLDDPGPSGVDWRDAYDAFDIYAESDLTRHLFTTWVFVGGETDELDIRDATLAEYSKLASRDPGWTIPDVIPMLLADWDFDEADGLFEEMNAILADAQSLLDDAATRDLAVPDHPQTHYESVATIERGFDTVRSLQDEQRETLDAVLAAHDHLDEPTGFFEDVGLYRTDLAADIVIVDEAFEDGQYDDAVELAQVIEATLDDAESVGTKRVAIAAGSVFAAILLIVLLVWFVRRRRSYAALMKNRPLSGIRVVDLTVERGELCGRLLSDLGAEALRVEPPDGSASRQLPPLAGDQSLFFAFRNAGKLSVGLDLGNAKDAKRFEELLAHSDVLIDSAEPGTREDSLSPAAIAARHPHLIVTSITAYGRTGPYAGRDVPNAVLDATGGMAFKAGAADSEPLLPPGNIADDTASMHAAFAIECALLQQAETGAGQVIDLSVNEACAQIADWSLSNWTRSLHAGSPSLDSRIGPGPVYTILPCLDGYVRLVIIAPRHWKAMRAWLGEPDYLQEPEYETFMGRFGIADAILNPLYAELFSTMTMLEVSEECQNRGIVCTPILKPSDVLANPHFEARGSFDQVETPSGATMAFASGFFEINGDRIGPTGPPPNEPGQDTKAVFASLGKRRSKPKSTPSGRPLAGLKVMDFGHGGVGVETSRLLAEYGADVVKIESRSYPDFIRVVLGGEMSPSFATSSRSKRSVGVDAKSPEGADFLRRMARHTDIAVENNSTGIMDSMGLGFGDLSAENPAITMMSSQLMGSRGPWAKWSGYGPNTQVTGGMTHLWNYEGDDEPAGSMSIFPDHFAGRTGAVAALAGVLGRKLRGDQGIHIEVCQVEQVINVMADLLAKESLDPGSVVPRGNHNDRGTPWGLYQCADGDNWVAICTRDDRDWRGLAQAMGSPEWAMTDDLAVVAGRREREGEIDALIGAWTIEHAVDYVVDVCLGEGVPSGPMLNSQGQYNDPHLKARGFIVELDQPPIGKMAFEGPAFQATRMDRPDIRPAPSLGAHTRDVAKEIGYTDAEIDELLAAGVLELDHPPEP